MYGGRYFCLHHYSTRTHPNPPSRARLRVLENTDAVGTTDELSRALHRCPLLISHTSYKSVTEKKRFLFFRMSEAKRRTQNVAQIQELLYSYQKIFHSFSPVRLLASSFPLASCLQLEKLRSFFAGRITIRRQMRESWSC